MSDESKKKPSGRPIGRIKGPFDFGGDEEENSERHDALTAKLQKGETTTSQEGLQSSSQNVMTAKEQPGKTANVDATLQGKLQRGLTAREQEGIVASNQSVKKPKIPPHMKQQTFYLPKHLAHWLKVHAAITEQDVSSILTKLVEEYKAKHEH